MAAFVASRPLRNRRAIESGSHAGGPPDALSRRRDVEHPPGVPRDPAPLDLRRPARPTRLRVRDHAAQDAPRAHPGPLRGRLGRPAAHPAARGLRRVQGQPRRDGGRPRVPAARDPRGPGRLSDPRPRAARLRGRRRHRHARRRRARPRATTSSSSPPTRTCSSSSDRASASSTRARRASSTTRA